MEESKQEAINLVAVVCLPASQNLKNDNKNSYYSSNSSIQNSNSIINFNICKSIKKIGDHKIYKKNKKNIKKIYTAEFITDIQNIFVSCGTNNELIIYNDSYEKINIYKTEDWIYNASELDISVIEKNLVFMHPLKKDRYLFSR